MSLPDCFCWTRFGTEAAQTIEQIFARKEQERVANDGEFLWGIGNAIGPSVRALLKEIPAPEVLFSPIRSAPKGIDVAPMAVAAWTDGETLDGGVFRFPKCSLVTSRYNPINPKGTHYALVCHSDEPLSSSGLSAELNIASLRNLMTGRPVGASQVTAVVQRGDTSTTDSGSYRVAMRAKLVNPYFVRLRGPVPLAEVPHTGCWSDIVRSAWEGRIRDALNRGDSAIALQCKLAFEH